MPRKATIEKRNRQNLKNRARNRAYRSRMRGAIKKVRALAAAGDRQAAEDALSPTLSLIDATARKGIIHANTASRYKSRLVRLVRSQEEAPA